MPMQWNTIVHLLRIIHVYIIVFWSHLSNHLKYKCFRWRLIHLFASFFRTSLCFHIIINAYMVDVGLNFIILWTLFWEILQMQSSPSSSNISNKRNAISIIWIHIQFDDVFLAIINIQKDGTILDTSFYFLFKIHNLT